MEIPTTVVFDLAIPHTGRLLLAQGVCVDARDQDNCNALFFCCDGEWASELIAAGAQPTAFTLFGYTPLHVQNAPDVVQVLLDNGVQAHLKTVDGQNALFQKSCAACVDLLLNEGLDPNCVDLSGLTPLHTAQTPEVAHALVFGGADPDKTTREGSPRAWFAQQAAPEMLEAMNRAQALLQRQRILAAAHNRPRTNRSTGSRKI